MSTEAPIAIPSGIDRRAEPVSGTGSDAEGAALEEQQPGFDVLAASVSAGEPASRAGHGLRGGRAPQAMFAALVAWTITVAPAAFSRGAPVSARVAAVLAVLCGVAAPLLAVVRRRLARHLGISVFLALVTLAWLLASPALQPSRLDPIRAAIGAVAWGVFALSWRDRWLVRRQLDPDPDAPILQARAHLPPLSTAIVAVGSLASLALLVLAWRVRDHDRALLAQSAAVACAVALISASSAVAVARGRRQAAGTRRLTQHAVRPLLVLIAFALLGAIVMMLR
jgi:hypothetical protein